jgi:hypothetical protein
MKLLPFHTYSQVSILAATPVRATRSKGKRKAAEEELVGQLPTKKSMLVDDDDDLCLTVMDMGSN